MKSDEFLKKAAPLLDQYVNASLGTGDLTSNNAGCREEVWKILRNAMLEADKHINIEIKSAQDVFDATITGKITVKQGEKLLDMYLKLKD